MKTAFVRLTDDRLVGSSKGEFKILSPKEWREIQSTNQPTYAEIYDKLAEYERLEEKGLLLRLSTK